MPSYKKYLIAASLLLSVSGCSNSSVNFDNKTTNTINKSQSFKTVAHKKFELEDQYIIYALEYENQKSFNNARELYTTLFEKTNKHEYLLKYASLSFLLRDYKSVKAVLNSADFNNVKEEEQLLRMYALSLFRLKDYKNSLEVSKRLAYKYDTDINHELLGTIYLQLKEYNKAYDEFETAYKMNKSINTLMSLTNMQFYYLNEKQKAKDTLKKQIELTSYSYGVCLQLLSFYEKDKQNEEIVKLLKKMYFEYKRQNNKASFSKTKSLLARYLGRTDINQAIEFFENNGNDNILLLDLYKRANRAEQSYDLLEKLYNQTNNLDYLAQMAIIEFELAPDKEAVLNSVISKFEKALQSGINNATYENYLAYLLIDYDLDVKKGLVLVKKALKKEPNNIAFIDTLAWGEYKLKNCEEAFIQMQRVVQAAGLEDEEIKLHWEKIKECTK